MKTGLAAILFFAACTSSSSNNGVCGDGHLDSGEQCDDGNNVSGDGCSATCTIEQAPQPVCGNGAVETGEQCDDGNTTSGDGCSSMCKHEYALQATWAFKSTQTTGTLNCPTGYDTAAVYMQEVDANGNNVGQPTIDLFTCSDLTGMVTAVPSGTYQTWIEITNTTNSMKWGQSVDAIADLTAANATYSADLYIDGGYFALKWVLVGSVSNSTLSCANAGADSVETAVSLSNGTSTVPITDVFTCADGQGVTSVLPADSYTVSIDALNASMQPLSGTATLLTNKTINIKNQVTDLGTVMLPIDGK